MKKAIINGFFGIALVFAMVSCNGNATTADTTPTDTTGATMEQNDEHCMRHCEMTCPDSVCLANKCENCACPDSSACRQKPACKGEGNCCKEQKAEAGCCKEQKEGCKGQHEGCKGQHEGCKKECEHHK